MTAKIVTTAIAALAIAIAGAGYANADPTPTPDPNPAPGVQWCPDSGWIPLGANGFWISGSCPAGTVGPYLPGLPGPNQPSPFAGGGNGASGSWSLEATTPVDADGGAR